MHTFCINLNIHYSISDKNWDMIGEVYQKMPNWIGYIEEIPTWYGEKDRVIEASVESSGIQITGSLPKEEWDVWFLLLKEKLTEKLGYEIGEPEEGYDFMYDI